MDEEYAMAQLEGLDDDQLREYLDMRSKSEYEASLLGYDLYAEKLNQLIDAINLQSLILRSAFGGKGDGEGFKAAPRPKTLFQKELDKKIAEFEKREMARDMAAWGF